MEKLKNCPFCGGKAYLETHHRAFINAKTTKVAFVRCMDCNARSGRVKLGDYGKTSYSIEANRAVTKAWNERACERTIPQSLPEANPAPFTQGSQEITDKNISVAENLKNEAEYIKNNIELSHNSIIIRGGLGWH